MAAVCRLPPAYSIAFGKPAGHKEVAPREFDVHSRWKPARKQKTNEGAEELDSRPLHGRRQGGKGERLPQGRLMCAPGGGLREKQKRR